MVDYEAWERVGLLIDSASGFIFILLGILLLFVKPRTRLQMAFSVFAIGFGSAFAFQNLVHEALRLLPDWTVGFGLLAFPGAVALGWLALHFPHAPRRTDRNALLGAGAILAAMILITIFVVVPIGPDLFSVSGPIWLGTVSLAATALIIGTMLAAAFLWAGRASRMAKANQATAARDLARGAVALTLFAHVNSGILLIAALHAWAGGAVIWLRFTFLMAALVVISAAIGAHWIIQGSRSAPPIRRTFIAAGLATFGALAFGAAFAALTQPLIAQDLGPHGIARFIGFLIFAHLILRRHMFDIDLKIKWTISKGAVASIFIAVFFILSVTAENFLTDKYGWAVGGVGAGLMLFAINPLQRIGESVANAAMPNVRPMSERTVDERHDMYADVVRAAWEDGTLTRAERSVMATVRDRLGLTTDEAEAIERRTLG